MSWSFRTNGNFVDFVHTDETSLAVENTIISLHNTSKCVSWSLPEDETRISFTIDEAKYSNVLVTDIDFDGTAMNSQDDFETGIVEMFPGLAGGDGGSGYLVYTALISQGGSPDEAPTVDTLFEDTIGGDWLYQYVGAGSYFLFNEAITQQNTIVFISSTSDTKIATAWAENGGVTIKTRTSGTLSDGGLNLTPIEIRVYP